MRRSEVLRSQELLNRPLRHKIVVRRHQRFPIGNGISVSPGLKSLPGLAADKQAGLAREARQGALPTPLPTPLGLSTGGPDVER